MNRRIFLGLASDSALALISGGESTASGKPDIVDIAAANPELSALVTALTAAGLVDALKGPGPFTIFAPSNAAFAKLPAGTLDMLPKPENKDKLIAVLSYHVVRRNLKTFALVEKTQVLATTSGRMLRTTGTMAVTANGAHFLPPDIVASNGVIDVLDAVLLPKL